MSSHPPTTPPPPSGPNTPPPPSGPGRKGEALYPAVELAELWRCSKDHIYDLIAKGELRSVQLGIGKAKTRIPESAAAEFLARRTSKARAA